MMISLILVGAGGFFGAVARYIISRRWNDGPPGIPAGTLLVNLSGAFLIGLLTGTGADGMVVLLLGMGFFGAFTTFSTLNYEILQMYLKKHKKKMLIYTSITYGGGLLLAYAGFLIGSIFAL